MKIISFAWTSDALLAGRKTCTCACRHRNKIASPSPTDELLSPLHKSRKRKTPGDIDIFWSNETETTCVPASQADLHNDAGLTERVVAAREAEIIERMIDRQERAPIKHRALPRTETVKPVASDERRWLMPTGRIRWPFITLNPALSMLLNMSLCNLLLAGDDAVLWVGIALEGPDTLIVERCAEREKHARRVNSAGGITGGTYYRYELQAAGWQPGRYLVEIVDGVAVARKDRRAE